MTAPQGCDIQRIADSGEEGKYRSKAVVCGSLCHVSSLTAEKCNAVDADNEVPAEFEAQATDVSELAAIPGSLGALRLVVHIREHATRAAAGAGSAAEHAGGMRQQQGLSGGCHRAAEEGAGVLWCLHARAGVCATA